MRLPAMSLSSIRCVNVVKVNDRSGGAGVVCASYSIFEAPLSGRRVARVHVIGDSQVNKIDRL